MKPNFAELLAYTRESNFDQLRLKAFECLVELGALQKPELLPYILNVVASDPSPYIRRNLLKIFTTGLGSLAIFGGKEVLQNRPAQSSFGEMIVEEEGGEGAMGETAMKRRKGLAREGIVGAMKALQEELSGVKVFAEALWKTIEYAITSCFFLEPLLTMVWEGHRSWVSWRYRNCSTYVRSCMTRRHP